MANPPYLSRPWKSYGLVQHLKLCCNENPEYMPLLASFSLDSINFSNMVETTSVFYSHYSRHDKTHIDSVISNIERILGSDRISALSPTDTWLILMSVYSHDIGMMIDPKKLDALWHDAKFSKFVASLKRSQNRDYVNAANTFLNDMDELRPATEIIFPESGDYSSGMPAMLRYSWYTRLIVAEYFRRTHALISRDTVLNNIEAYCHHDCIPNRLVNMVANCAAAHGGTIEAVLKKLDRYSKGYANDNVHPRFAAVLLRLGDVLDIDNNRFSPYMAAVAGGMPEDSRAHKLKHKCIDQLYISSEHIELRSDLSGCTQEDLILVYRLTHDWFDLIENELRGFNKYWFRIVPEEFTGHAPWLEKRDIAIKGSIYDKDDILSNFSINYNRAADIMKDLSIYAEQLAFCREIVQNAFDATKIQLFRSITQNNSSFTLYPPQNLTFKPPQKSSEMDTLNELIYLNNHSDTNQFDIQLYIIEENNDTEQKIRFCVKDNGIGIDRDSISRMKSVGEVVTDSKYEEILNMPGWMKPTGEFGIGLHSAFACSDRIDIQTFVQSNGFHATIQLFSMNQGGKIVILPHQALPRRTSGSTVEVTVKSKKLLQVLCRNSQTVSGAIKFEYIISFIKDSIYKMLAPNISKLNIIIISQNNSTQSLKPIPSLFKGLEELCRECNNLEDQKIKLSSHLLDNCIIWNLVESKEIQSIEKQYGLNEYFGLLGDFSGSGKFKNKDLVLQIRFTNVYHESNSLECSIAYKGSYVIKANKQIQLPFTISTIHLLGRDARYTITIQRDFLIPEAEADIYSDVCAALDRILLYITTHEQIANLEEESLLSFALYLYRWKWDNKAFGRNNAIYQKAVDDALTYIKSAKKTEKIPIYQIRDDVLNFMEISLGDLPDLLELYYFRKEERFYGQIEKIIGVSGNLQNNSFITRNIWWHMQANISLCEIIIAETEKCRKVILEKYSQGQNDMIIANDEVVHFIIERAIKQRNGYIPAFKQYEALAVNICDNISITEWPLCTAFIELPDYTEESEKALAIKNAISNKERLKLLELQTSDKFILKNLFNLNIQNIVSLQSVSSKSSHFDEEIVCEAYLSFLILFQEIREDIRSKGE